MPFPMWKGLSDAWCVLLGRGKEQVLSLLASNIPQMPRLCRMFRQGGGCSSRRANETGEVHFDCPLIDTALSKITARMKMSVTEHQVREGPPGTDLFDFD